MLGNADNVTMSVASYVSPDGRRDPKRRGILLADLKASFHGDEGKLFDPFNGNAYPLSLSPWDRTDPQKTYIVVTFIGKRKQ